jgi:hypothetical protein
MKSAFTVAMALSLSLLAAVLCTPAHGEDFSYLTLKGLNTVTVSFKGFHSDLQRFGVDEARLHSMVEKRLQNAGITIVTPAQALTLPDAAQMLVDLHVNVAEYRYYSYSLILKVIEKVPLAGQHKAFVSQTVWSKGTYGTVLDTRLLQISEDLGGLMDRFVSDHGRENAVATE